MVAGALPRLVPPLPSAYPREASGYGLRWDVGSLYDGLLYGGLWACGGGGGGAKVN